MFDTNKFKRSVKDWVRDHPHASMEELVDFCEELIPPNHFNSHSWLLDQTAGWYQHVLDTRKSTRLLEDLSNEDIA